MNQSAATDLQKLGRDAAQDVAGVDTVEEVEVVSGEDSTDRPVYKFYFLIEKTSIRSRDAFLHRRDPLAHPLPEPVTIVLETLALDKAV